MLTLRAVLERAHAAEQAQLRAELEGKQALLLAQLAEVERRRAELESSHAERVEELKELRARLSDVGEGIALERIDAAKQALAEGDTSLAAQIFEEIEAMEQASIDRAAEAAFQLGKIADDEIRWADAAEHYGRAARLAPTYRRLLKAQEFAWRAGALDHALDLGEELLATALGRPRMQRR
jgi:hypothetical protein